MTFVRACVRAGVLSEGVTCESWWIFFWWISTESHGSCVHDGRANTNTLVIQTRPSWRAKRHVVGLITALSHSHSSHSVLRTCGDILNLSRYRSFAVQTKGEAVLPAVLINAARRSPRVWDGKILSGYLPVVPRQLVVRCVRVCGGYVCLSSVYVCLLYIYICIYFYIYIYKIYKYINI